MTDKQIDNYDGLAEVLQTIGDAGNFQFEECSERLDLADNSKYTKLKLTSEQAAHISALVQHIPSLTMANALKNVYVLRFPYGVSGTLMRLRGGLAPMLVDPITGRFAAHGVLYPLQISTAIMQAFNAMSIASGQYFLSQINDNIKLMRIGINQILEFLYGDKKAELMAEVNFVRYAYQNFASIMTHEDQCAATIGSLHNSKKIAMKDIEFYMGDLESTIGAKDSKDIGVLVEKAFQIKESLEFSMQLYGMSSLLEVYYSQNRDPDYLKYVENDISVYIDKCEKRMLGIFSALKVLIDSTKGTLLKKLDKPAIAKQVEEFVESLNQGEESEMRRSLRTALNTAAQRAEYYMTSDGTIYLKTA